MQTQTTAQVNRKWQPYLSLSTCNRNTDSSLVPCLNRPSGLRHYRLVKTHASLLFVLQSPPLPKNVYWEQSIHILLCGPYVEFYNIILFHSKLRLEWSHPESLIQQNNSLSVSIFTLVLFFSLSMTLETVHLWTITCLKPVVCSVLSVCVYLCLCLCCSQMGQISLMLSLTTFPPFIF